MQLAILALRFIFVYSFFVSFIDNPYNNECIEDRNVVLQRNNTPATVTLQLTLRYFAKAAFK